MCGIQDKRVHPSLHQRRNALIGIFGSSYARAHPQAPLFILTGMRIHLRLFHILDGDESAQLEVLVDHEHLLDAVRVEQVAYLSRRGGFERGHKPILRRHGIAHFLVHFLFKAHVAPGNDPQEFFALRHRHARNPVFTCELEQLTDRRVRANRDWIADDSGFVLLHGANFASLGLNGHVLVDHAYAAFLGKRNGKF